MDHYRYMRYLVILGGVLLQICLGSLYSWSLFNAPLMDKFGWSSNDVVMTYSIAVSVLALTTILSGRLQDKIGPRIVATIGGALYGIGLILASYSDTLGMLYLSYGIIGGVGVGFAYVCPLSACIKWFPNDKGLITGVIVGSFALGSLISKYATDFLLITYGIENTFLYLGVIYLLVTTFSAQLLVAPPSTESLSTSKNNKCDQLECGGMAMLKIPSFYLVWSMYLCACLGGLLVIGFAADIGVELAGLDVTTATSAVSVIALFNLVGRLLCGALSDRIGHINMIIAMFFITAVMMVGLSLLAMDKLMFFTLLAGIALCFGGFTSVFPAILGDLYGTKNIGGNIGLIYQAYGGAALLSPVVINLADGLRSTFMITATIAGAGMLMSCMLLLVTDKSLMERFYRPLLSS